MTRTALNPLRKAALAIGICATTVAVLTGCGGGAAKSATSKVPANQPSVESRSQNPSFCQEVAQLLDGIDGAVRAGGKRGVLTQDARSQLADDLAKANMQVISTPSKSDADASKLYELTRAYQTTNDRVAGSFRNGSASDPAALQDNLAAQKDVNAQFNSVCE